MENTNQIRYEEKFFFRTRVHTITSSGIKTQQRSFFNSSEITTRFEELGSLLQYKSDLRLQDITISTVLLIIGIKGLTKGFNDDVVFAISTILIFSSIYWIVSVLFALKHIGSFYFSNSTEKTPNSFEIKSRYPPDQRLELFLSQIRARQKEMAIENLLRSITVDLSFEDFKSEATFIKNTFSMEENEFASLLVKMKEKYPS